MRLKLRINAVHICQCRDGRNFAVLKIKIVTSKDVSEEMIFKENIYCIAGSKSKIAPLTGAPMSWV
jgi:hypothetical protein